jgi:hypothetical protein
MKSSILHLIVIAALPLNLWAQVSPEGSSRDGVAAPTNPIRAEGTPAGVDMTTAQYGLLPGRPRVTPTRTATPPAIDGNLDDAVWANAAYINQFTQESPDEGAPATQNTEVWIAYDDDHIYFAFYAHYTDISLMRANRVQRDRANQDDLMTVYFDTFLDQQRGYDFDVNGYGVQGDGLLSVGRRGGAGGTSIPPADRSWDALFDTAGRLVDDGYIAEMAIPFKSLRFPTPPDGQPHRWGFQIVREVKSLNTENMVWSPMARGESSFFTQMGLLEGMTDISITRNIEVMPTFVAVQQGSIDATGPRFVNDSANPDFGVNLKYGITPNLTADFTVNPDFSQIESDRTQLEVNLRFPISFPELRPFFVEGSEIFNIQAPVTFVHTRTIVDPDWGAKLSGQLGRFTLGLLAANDRAAGNLEDPDDPGYGDKAHTFIARAQYDLYTSSNVGVLFTDREFLDSHSRLFGADGNFRLSSTLSGDFKLVGTWHQALGATEEQDGHMFAARIGRSGRYFNGSIQASQVSPQFRTDVGFVRRRDTRSASANTSYRFWPTGSALVNWGPSFDYGRIYNFDEVLQDEDMGVGLNFQFVRNISANLGFDRTMELFQGTEYRTQGFSGGGNWNSRSFSLGANLGVSEVLF